MDTMLARRLSHLSLVAAITLLFCPGLKAQLVVNGYGIYEEFGAPLYAVKLDSEERISNPKVFFANENSKELSLRVLTPSLGERQWCRFWTQNIAINISTGNLERLADSILEVCEQVAGDLAMGDQIVFYRESNEITLLSVNEVAIAVLKGSGIFEAFLSPFLGDSPVSNDLKTALLRQPSEKSEAAIVYHRSNVTPDRVSVVRSWAVASESESKEFMQTNTDSTSQPDIAANNSSKSDPANADIHSITTETENLASLKDSLSSPTWSPVAFATTEQVASYETSGFGSEAVMASAAYIPNSSPLFASTANLDISQIIPKQKLTRVSLLDIQQYQTKSLRSVYENIEYPFIAQRRGREGALRLKVEIDRSGNIHQISSLESTRYDELNEAAQLAVQLAAPFEAPPLAEDEEFFELLLPIRFALQ